MAGVLVLVAVILIVGILSLEFSERIGVPMLFAFIVVGMLFGSDGLFQIPFANFELAEVICSFVLIFIMFYGGFGTKWEMAKPVAGVAIVLSSLGTVLTAVLVGLFVHFVLGKPLLYGLLLGSVIGSTDAASVFSILRSRRLNLKGNTDSLLEMESGSNDPFSYLMTVMVLSLMQGHSSPGSFLYLLFQQLFWGIAGGFVIAFLFRYILLRFRTTSSGFAGVLMVAIAIFSYAAPSLLNGNGYLSAYITGIVLGNTRFEHKRELVHFFNGLTGMMQMALFFLLGLLSFPSLLPGVFKTGLAVALFITFVARPIAITLLMLPFKGTTWPQIGIVAWAGLRGAASIVFAIMATVQSNLPGYDLFHTVFFIVLFSILIQGSLLPPLSRKLKMVDSELNVMKTFTDYTDEIAVQYIQFGLPEGHQWVGKSVRELALPPDLIFVLLHRDGVEHIPQGDTVLKAGDQLILSGQASDTREFSIYENAMEAGDHRIGKSLSEISSKKKLVIFIKRGENIVIPKGDTILEKGDVVVTMDRERF